MDILVKPMVKYFNDIGLKTVMSCSGHIHLDGRKSLFWITFDKNLTEEIVYDNLLIIDTTEQKIQRPSKNQKKYYSGKKKQHNLKTTIAINEKNKINFVSKTYEGSIHDLNILKKEISKIPKTRKVFLDKGYIGIILNHPSNFTYP